jgi:transposase
VIDGLTGQIIAVQIFVAVLGASSLTYAEAVWSQKPNCSEGRRQRIGAFFWPPSKSLKRGQRQLRVDSSDSAGSFSLSSAHLRESGQRPSRRS